MIEKCNLFIFIVLILFRDKYISIKLFLDDVVYMLVV